MGFLTRTFTIHRTAGEGGGYFLNYSLPLPPVSQTYRQQLYDYCRELASTQGRKKEKLISKRMS